MGQRSAAPAQALDVRLDPVEEAVSAIGPYLMTSARPALSSRAGRVPACQVADHALRLVEGADHVLAQRVVDRGLAAHRGIHLRQQVVGTCTKGTPRM
jgi:hypothetical protein